MTSGYRINEKMSRFIDRKSAIFGVARNGLITDSVKRNSINIINRHVNGYIDEHINKGNKDSNSGSNIPDIVNEQRSLLDRFNLEENDGENFELEQAIGKTGSFLPDSRIKSFISGILKIRIPQIKIYSNTLSDRIARKYNADAVTMKNKILFRAGKYSPDSSEGVALLGHEFTHASLAPQQQNFENPDLRRKNEESALLNEGSIRSYISGEEITKSNDGIMDNRLDLNKLNNSFINHQFYKESGNPEKKNQIEDTEFLNNPYNTQFANFNVSRGKNFVPPKTDPDINTGLSDRSNNKEGVKSRVVPETAPSSRDIPSEKNNSGNQPAYISISHEQLRIIKDEIYRDLMERIRIDFERGG